MSQKEKKKKSYLQEIQLVLSTKSPATWVTLPCFFPASAKWVYPELLNIPCIFLTLLWNGHPCFLPIVEDSSSSRKSSLNTLARNDFLSGALLVGVSNEASILLLTLHAAMYRIPAKLSRGQAVLCHYGYCSESLRSTWHNIKNSDKE